MKSDNWSSYWVTADIDLIEQSVEVAGIIITATVATKAVVSLYDGVNSSGRLLGTFRVAADDTKPFLFPQPIPCTRGLFIDIDANTTGVTVFYRPLKGNI